MNFYIGNYTQHGINLLDENFNLIYTTNDLCNPSYICQNKNMLYCLTETFPGNIVSYRKVNSGLKFINSIEVGLDGPCFVTVDSIRNILYVANYTNGSLFSFKLNADGSIGKKLYYKSFGTNSHIHHICFTPNRDILFLTDLGNDKLFAYKVIYHNGILKLEEIASFSFPTGTQPRHMAIDNFNNLYVITESSCRLYYIQFSSMNHFKLISSFSILPDNVLNSANFTGCAIKISDNKDFIYVSVRGHNSISVFALKDHFPILIQNISCNGTNPRDIEICSCSNLLLCANYLSNSISFFKIDIKTGFLKYKDSISIDSPSCIIKSY